MDYTRYKTPPLHRWMGSLPDNVRLSQLSIPGSHNSVARNTMPRAECQTEFLSWQLNNGIRYLDIRCANQKLMGTDQWFFRIHHGIISLGRTFDEVLTACFTFLSRNPRETIIMRMQQEWTEDSDRYKNILLKHLVKPENKNKFYTINAMPTLGQVRGKIVLLTSWPYLGIGLEFRLQNHEDTYDNPALDEKVEKVLTHIKGSIKFGGGQKFYITHLSATGAWYTGWMPKDYAYKINPYINIQLRKQPFLNARQLGIVVMDYAGKSLKFANGPDRHLIWAIVVKNDFLSTTSGELLTSYREDPVL